MQSQTPKPKKPIFATKIYALALILTGFGMSTAVAVIAGYPSQTPAMFATGILLMTFGTVRIIYLRNKSDKPTPTE